MEHRGLLTRVLLREIRLLGKKLYPQRVNNPVLNETNDFFAFLKPFANHRGGGDDIPEWQFRKNNIQVGILYVARQEKIDAEGLIPYQNRLEQNIRLGCKRIYVFGRRQNNVKAVEELTYLVQKHIPSVKVHREYYFEMRGEKTPAVCAVVSNNFEFLH